MHRYWGIEVILLAFAASACAAAAAGEGENLHIDPRPSAAQFRLAPEEIARFSPLALAGDENAGLCLLLHYSFVGFQDKDAVRYWATIAAENGKSTKGRVLDGARAGVAPARK